MTRHSTNDTELFRKMTSLIFMDKISPFGHCHKYKGIMEWELPTELPQENTAQHYSLLRNMPIILPS